ALLKTSDEHRSFVFLVEVVITRQGRGDRMVCEESLRTPRVFSRDNRHLVQDPNRPEGDVVRVPDRSTDDVEGPRHPARKRLDEPIRHPTARVEKKSNLLKRSPQDVQKGSPARPQRAKRRSVLFAVR